jgi:hypothetical protein
MRGRRGKNSSDLNAVAERVDLLGSAASGWRTEEILRGVAQLGRALGSGPRGRKFKSCRPD